MAKTSRTRVPRSSKTKDICFVLMPFGGWLDDYYERIYKPAISACGLEPHRADDVFRPGTVVHDIWDYTTRAKVLLADLSGRNANVFYELGLAHALAKPVILVASSIDDVPFDLQALRIIIYDKNEPDWGSVLSKKVSTAIRSVLKSPLAAVLPAFLEVKPETGKPSVSVHEKEMLEIRQDIDLLRREIRTPPQPSLQFVLPSASQERLAFRNSRNELNLGTELAARIWDSPLTSSRSDAIRPILKSILERTSVPVPETPQSPPVQETKSARVAEKATPQRQRQKKKV